VGKVLDLLCEKSMKSRDTNDVMAVKAHYYATVIRHAATSYTDNDKNAAPWIKW
jgi:hypothetical protein